ncbi:hypothetical protein [Streptomyces sp. NRRL B-24720]|uniref:LexA family protein n=1 Tax=Streptomyces sp. NRRL B-24720 TaxID=1476876 RepID=UPI002D219A15|nr:hypothetical protein [Streptomyces sp. NRRL B-24720]
MLRVIRNSIIECGEGSTVRQIGERVGLFSTRSVAHQLDGLGALLTGIHIVRYLRGCVYRSQLGKPLWFLSFP